MRRRDPAWRFAIFGRPEAPWRDTREAALEDAIDAGLAERDEQRDIVFLTVPAEILSTFDPVETMPRRFDKNGPSSTSAPSRIERAIARREGRKSARF